MGTISSSTIAEIKLATFNPKEVSGTYRADFASIILKDGRYNISAKIKVPQDRIIRRFLAFAAESALKKSKKNQLISIKSRLTLMTSGDSDRE